MEWLTALLTLGVPTITALGLFYRNVRETHTNAAKEAEALREKEQERITKVLGLVQQQYEKTLERLDATEAECASLRDQQNKNIREINIMSGEVEQLLKDNEKLTKQVDALRSQLDTKDKVIQEQDGRIKQQEKRIHELEDEYKRVKTQVALLVKQLKEAQLPLPDGVEHEGNEKQESGD